MCFWQKYFGKSILAKVFLAKITWSANPAPDAANDATRSSLLHVPATRQPARVA
jgi:hypothetical protein